MNAAQTAWAALTGLFLAGSVVTLVADVPSGGTASAIMLGIAVLGWIILGGMILSDVRRIPAGD